ncbi:MAG: hypothetical protein L6R37_000743 [Teloschistes peruensis]|nr:MAG: hypothetical protein L6R37_000743 [Teloschistes peruensis]
MLEQQQLQLVAGLQNLYKRTIDNQGWPGRPLDITSTGHPLVHDILERLDAIHIEGANAPNHFEEDFDVMQQRLLANGAVPMNRQASVESESSEDTATIPDTVSPFGTSHRMPFFQTPPPPLQPPLNMLPHYSNSSLSYPHPQELWFGGTHVGYDQTPCNGPMPSPTDWNDPSHVSAHANPCLPMFAYVDEEGRSDGFPNVDMAHRFGLSRGQRL